jgi:hypothetical protein
MHKWIGQTVLKRWHTNGQQINKEIFNILSSKGNANQNDTEILSYPSKNGNLQENKQQMYENRIMKHI